MNACIYVCVNPNRHLSGHQRNQREWYSRGGFNTNHRRVWSVDSWRGCPPNCRNWWSRSSEELRQRSQELAYELMPRHFILEFGIWGEELPNASINTYRVKGACADWQGAYELSAHQLTKRTGQIARCPPCRHFRITPGPLQPISIIHAR